MNATPSSPKGSYGPPTAASSSADSPNPQPHNAQDELSRQPLRAAVEEARDKGLGVWATDDTQEGFTGEEAAAAEGIGEALVLPKLFRRCVNHRKALAKGFQSELA